MPYQNIDLRQDSQYNLVLNKQRTLNATITAYYISGTTTGDTYIEFDFSAYTGATLQVRLKPDSPFVVLELNTDDGSIVLPASGGTFKLVKSDTDLAKVRAGEYMYDMYLRGNANFPKRAFLSGSFTITPNITT
jgi:hypothetical protein